jgi:FAD/FMN-containing dehydrogenase
MSAITGLSIEGRVVTRSDPDWDEARKAGNLAADLHPAAVAFVEGAGGIAEVIRFAAERDLKVTAQGTGHGAAAPGPLDDTIVIKTEGMRGTVNPAAVGLRRRVADPDGHVWMVPA